MFGQLKNKLSGFVGKLIGRKEQEPSPKESPQIEKSEQTPQTQIEHAPNSQIRNKTDFEHTAEFSHEHDRKPKEHAKVHTAQVEEKELQNFAVERPQKIQTVKKQAEEPQSERGKKEIAAKVKPAIKKQEAKKSVVDSVHGLFEKKDERAAFEKVQVAAPKIETKESVRFEAGVGAVGDEEIRRLEKKALDGKKGVGVKIGIGKGISTIFSSQIEIEKKDVEDLLDELEISLIEADVGLEVSQEVKKRLEKRLCGLKVQKSKMHEEVKQEIRQVLVEIMEQKNSKSFAQRISEATTPVKILFVGPNGAGKTTTIAKFAKMFEAQGKKVCFAAADTFRAAAIEQLSEHAQRLGVPIIKSKYGADPASVAFDAIKHARANKLDVVLIDSAGRQDTNSNLIDEMKKIVRVVSPDLKIYIGESIGGSALAEQIRTFNEAIGIDGAVLTKLDCDAKGGSAISLSYASSVPIIFLGVGQEYEDLEPFDAKKIVDQIIG